LAGILPIGHFTLSLGFVTLGAANS
jgi:hypothetical protein